MKLAAAILLFAFALPAIACNPHVCKHEPTVCKYVALPYVCRT